MREATDAADEVIAALVKKLGKDDFTPYERNLIALAFDEGLLEGNNEANVDFEGSRKFSLRIIQEDHYDQHMDDDEDKPEWDDQFCYVVTLPAYVWIIE